MLVQFFSLGNHKIILILILSLIEDNQIRHRIRNGARKVSPSNIFLNILLDNACVCIAVSQGDSQPIDILLSYLFG